MKKNGILVAVLAVACLVKASPTAAQYYAFGKNKVQYENFQWQTLKSEHCEVFYYPQEEPIARLAVQFAEESYKDLSAKFGHEVNHTIPLIVYSSHHHFEQTNVSPMFVPEGVQGFTEFMKGRVVLPYTGSYAEFHHVLHHEMVHVFQFSILDETYKKFRRTNYVIPPLWFSEGQAEYWSTEWDAQGTMVLSDMVLQGHMPRIDELWQYDGTFTVYKLGQSLCQYIGETYGQDALRRLYTEIYKEDTFEKVIQHVTGVSARRLSEDWILAMKRKYYPEVKDRSELTAMAQGRAVARGVNLKAVAAPDSTLLGGCRYFFISARSGYTNIYSADYRSPERKVKSVIRGQRGAQFESFHPFESRIDVSPKGELAFVSKWDGKDALFLYDVAKKQILLRRHVDGLISLASPAWSRDGSRIAFSGISPSGRSDLYVLVRATGEIQRLTNDDYADTDPTWSPDGKEIAFASDRTRYGKDGHRNLFLLDTQTLAVRYLTCGSWVDQTPSWSPDGSRIAFASDRGGMFEIYTVDREGHGARVTHTLASTLDPAWLPDGKHILFTGFSHGGFGIYEMPVPTPARAAPVAMADMATTIATAGTAATIAPLAPTATESADGMVGSLSEPESTTTQTAPPTPAAKTAAATTTPAPADSFALNQTLAQEGPPDWPWDETLARSTEEPSTYKAHYGLDLVQGGISSSATANAVGGFQGAFSDLLGNHVYFFQVGNTAQTADEILTRMNLNVWSIHREHRWNYAMGVFHNVGDYENNIGFDYFERRAGMSAVASYPFSRFRRVDLSMSLYYDKKDYIFGPVNEGILTTHSISLVADNTLWAPTGPRDGSRLNLTGALTTNLTTGRNVSLTVLGDIRRYFRISQQTSFATRITGRASTGEDPDRFIMGGSLSMRGYPRDYFEGTRMVMANMEYRFPLLDRLVLGIPLQSFGLPGLEGAVFGDAGTAWEKFERMPPLKGSFGFGLRMNLAGYMVLRYDFARLTDFHQVSPGWQHEFYLGFDY